MRLQQRQYKHFFYGFSGLLLSLLTACTPFGLVTSSSQAVYNRYSWQQNLKNHKVAASVQNSIDANASFKDSHISVSSFNLRVLLVGTTPNNALRKEAAQIAAYTPDVAHVYNFIDVSDKPHDAYLSDSWLTTKVKSKIIADAKMPASNIKVITENGVVYLMGLLTVEQADIAVHTAQYTNGVKHVVQIFQYISYSTTKPSTSNSKPSDTSKPSSTK